MYINLDKKLVQRSVSFYDAGERRANEKIHLARHRSSHFVNACRFESAGSVEESAAHGTHVGNSATGRDHPIARRRLHGPSHGRRKGERLFIAGEAAKSLLVVDLRAGKVTHETRALA